MTKTQVRNQSNKLESKEKLEKRARFEVAWQEQKERREELEQRWKQEYQKNF